MHKKIIAIIPARGGSKGIPKKNIIPVAGKPLIFWSIYAAKHSRFVDEVFISTDDTRIGAVAQKCGAQVIKRPVQFATDTASSEDALLHALDVIEKEMDVGAVVFLQATSPVRENKDVDNAFQCFLKEKADSLFSCTPIEDHFIWEKRNGTYVSVNYDYHHRKRRQDIVPRYLENGSIYIFTPRLLREKHNRLGGKIAVYEMPFWKSWQIDSRDDVGICEYYLKKLKQQK